MDTPKKRPGDRQHVKKSRLDAEQQMQAADYVILGAITPKNLAVVHGVSINTIRKWVKARKRMIMPRRDRVVVEQHAPSRIYDITRGTGGHMRDDEVRDATKALEQAIVALQAKLGLRTFTYRQRSDGGW